VISGEMVKIIWYITYKLKNLPKFNREFLHNQLHLSMELLFVSAECYPVAKAGGLGDVAGALPKYLTQLGHVTKLVMPMYRTKFLYANQWSVVHKGYTNLGNWWFEFTVIKEKSNVLGFDLYLLDINGLLDREKIYGYDDDAERFTARCNSCA
jgi:starch synthase